MAERLGFVLGTRPEIIKLASVIDAAATLGVDHGVIHTNQHYSAELDAQFFGEFGIAAAAENLEVGSATHGAQTGRALERIEEVLLRSSVSQVVVQGDTNSALAGALAGQKLHIPVAHVEAGLRSFDQDMPEEVNRRLIDHMASHLFPPTLGAAEQLRREFVPGMVSDPSGNTIADMVIRLTEGQRLPLRSRERVALLTLHRPENVDDSARLAGLLSSVGKAARDTGLNVVFPAHPRTRQRLGDFGIVPPCEIEIVPPFGFRETVELLRRARLVLTDSGGLQEEACIVATPCVTLRTTTERPETVAIGSNIVAGVSELEIVTAAHVMLNRKDIDWVHPYGDGDAGYRIVQALVRNAGAESLALESEELGA